MSKRIFLAAVLISTSFFVGCPPQRPVAKNTNDESETTNGSTPVQDRADEISDALIPTDSNDSTDNGESTDGDEPGDGDSQTPTDNNDPKPTDVEEPKAADSAEPPFEEGETEKVLLGTADLLSGIPGEGALSVEQIATWLEDPKNHNVLQVELPQGLAAGAEQIQIPADNRLTRAKIELGRQLYFDRRLSSDATISCADCHSPDEGYARHTKFGVGVDGQEGGRNSPVSYNRILSGAQFWDGRAASLEDQAIGPIANPIEMANTHEVAVDFLKKNEGYKIQFEKIFADGVNIKNVGKAIATFERAIVTGPSAYDFYEPLRALEVAFKDDLEDLEEFKEEDPKTYAIYIERKKASDDHPISESAKRGREIFFSAKGNCTACHVGANFADEKYHNIGIGMDQEEPDLGRFVVTKEEKDKGAFKTPTVRNVALTAPYMHDGSLATLEDVVEWYVKGGHPNPHLSKDIKKLELNDEQKKDLVEFMKALTGDFPKVESGRLPE